MRLSTFFILLTALIASKCLAGNIIETKKLDKDSILKAQVSSSLLNFYSFMYSHFKSKLKCNKYLIEIYFSSRKFFSFLSVNFFGD